MRVTSILALAALTGGEAWADVTYQSGVEIYADSDDTQVATMTGEGTWTIDDDWSVTSHAAVDIVSSASIDVISAATPDFQTARGELGLGGARRLGDGTLAAKLVSSTEPDWNSISGQATYTYELAQRNAALNVAYGLTQNWIKDAREDNTASGIKETMLSHTWQVGFSQLLSRGTRLVVAHTGQLQRGYLASVYRRVRFGNGDVRPETHPRNRLRLAGAASLHQSLGKTLGATVSYRFYGDSWSIRSHTAQAGVLWELSERWALQLRARGYVQSDADFYRDSYEMPTEFFSFDKELARIHGVGGGAAVFWRLPDRFSASLRGEIYHQELKNFSELPRRTAYIGSAFFGRDW